MFRKHFKGLVSRWNKKTGFNGCVYDFSVDYDAIISHDDYIRSVFQEDKKLYLQVFLDDALYELSM